MSRNNNHTRKAWSGRIVGVGLIAAVFLIQTAVFSKAVGVYHTKQADTYLQQLTLVESRLEHAMQAPVDQKKIREISLDQKLRRELLMNIDSRLTSATWADASNGWACWELSKQGLRRATTDRTTATLAKAEKWALRGARSFNGVECLKQLASIYLRQNRVDLAEPYLHKVALVKPDDIESIERLGLIELTLGKWEDLSVLCEKILRKHPYSANAYYYRAYMAQEALKANRGDPKQNKEDLYLNTRQAYLMWQQKKSWIFFDARNLENLASALKLVDTHTRAKGASGRPSR